MLWILFSIVFLTAAAVLLKYGKHTYTDDRGRPAEANFRPAAYIVLAVWLLFTLLASTNTIDAGKVGLVKTFGDYTGRQSPGLNFKAPYQSVTEVNGRVIKHTVGMDGGKQGSAVSIDTQSVFATLDVTYQLQIDKATHLYSTVGEGYYRKIIEPRVQQAFKAETVKYKAIDIAANREKIREAVRAELDAALDDYGIDVTALTIRNLDFDTKFSDAIADKVAAAEQAKAADAKVAIAKANANSARETARGEADAIAIKGRALAENPKSIQQLAIEKLNPNVQVIVVPEGTDLLNLPTLQGAAATK